MKIIVTAILITTSMLASAAGVRTLSKSDSGQYDHLYSGFYLNGFEPISAYTICFENTVQDVCSSAYTGQLESEMDYGSGAHDVMRVNSCLVSGDTATVEVTLSNDYDADDVTGTVLVGKCDSEMMNFKNPTFETQEELDWR